jgi:dTDP-4-amino-4,6-dideoxygalactose transaminase
MIHHSMPSIDRASRAAALRVLRSGHLGPGPETAAFEKEIGKAVRRRHAVCTSSGHAALHLALLALGVGEGDEVIIPTYCCTALLNAVSYVGATPRLADVDGETYNLTPEMARRALRRRTAAIIVPHMLGLPADVDGIAALGPPVIEDAAMAIGARDVGSGGEISVFSFYATKMMATGQGGAVAADRGRIARRIRDLVSYDNRHDYRVRHNYTLSDLQAAIGRAQLRSLPRFIEKRRRIAGMYDRALAGHGIPRGRGHVYYRYALRLPRASRAARSRLKALGVEAKLPVFRPIHRYLGLPRRDFPAAEGFADRLLSIPIYPSLSLASARKVAHLVREALHP